MLTNKSKISWNEKYIELADALVQQKSTMLDNLELHETRGVTRVYIFSM